MDDNATDRPTRIYVGVGIGTYDNYGTLPQAVSQVVDVAGVFKGYGYEVRVIKDLSRGNTIPQLDEKLPPDVMPRGGCLVILWSGHGEPTSTGELHLIARDTARRQEAAITAERVTGMAARTGAGQILLILDTCHSGTGALSAADVADRVLREVPPDSPRVWFGVVASAMDFERSKDGVFGARLLKLLRQGPDGPELKLRWSSHSAGVRGDDLIDALQKEWDDPDQSPKGASTGNAWAMFPNPLYDPNAPERVVEHLLLAARGVEPGEEGFYFTGRAAQLERIVTWMGAGKPGVFVVTGPPGSGKSAIVGRIVSLSNPGERARLLTQGPLEHADPGEGSVHAHARGVTAERVVELIDEQLVQRGVLQPHVSGRRNRGDLLGAIQRSRKRPVIAVDGLDEAGSEAWRIAEDVIRLLASVSLIIVATRELPPRGSGFSLVQTLGGNEIADLGDEAIRQQTQTDVCGYVAKRLGGIG